MITIWGGATTRTLRVHWACHELGLTYRSELIGSRTGATQTDSFRALNAKEKIPVLVDGDFVLTESAAIIAYLADCYGAPEQLAPLAGTRERAVYDQWVSFVLMELDAHTLYVIRKHRDLAALYGEAPAAINTAIAGFQKQVRVAEIHLENEYASGRKGYVVGDRFSGADILLTGVLAWAEIYAVPFGPTLLRYLNQNRARPDFRSASKHNFSIKTGG